MNSLTKWIAQLKQYSSVLSATGFFVKTAEFPVLYFDYNRSRAWLSRWHSNLPAHITPSPPPLRLYESCPAFHPSKLFNPIQIPEIHNMLSKELGQTNYQVYPVVFNNLVIGLFAYLLNTESTSSTSVSTIKDRLFFTDYYIKNILWNDKWTQDSRTEENTHCLNKKSFLQTLFTEMSRARRLNLPVSLIVLQVDQWKTLESVYDSYQAHLLMKALSKNILRDTRIYDTVGVWEPGQLGLILPHTSESSAGRKAEKIRWIIQSSDFSKVFPSQDRLSLSLGLAEYPKVGRSAESLFKAVNKALSFAAQECGGNMTAVASPAVGFKPDFAVIDSTPHALRELT